MKNATAEGILLWLTHTCEFCGQEVPGRYRACCQPGLLADEASEVDAQQYTNGTRRIRTHLDARSELRQRRWALGEYGNTPGRLW